jgi:hypothetical protein
MDGMHSYDIYTCPLTGENLEHLQLEELCAYYRNRLDSVLRVMNKYFDIKSKVKGVGKNG